MKLRDKVLGPMAVLSIAGPAVAAGGAHLVDDAGVEAPGACHLETWVTAYADARGLANLAPACTPRSLQRVEIGAGVQYLRDGVDDAVAGPALKLHLASNETAGLALAAAAGWSVRRARFETASVVVPLSWAVDGRTTVNFNAGWMYARGARHRHDATYGAQLNRTLGRRVSLMGEIVGRRHLRAGGQLGLRWSPAGGALDLDLLAGRYVDGANKSAITLGLTFRR